MLLQFPPFNQREDYNLLHVLPLNLSSTCKLLNSFCNLFKRHEDELCSDGAITKAGTIAVLRSTEVKLTSDNVLAAL